MTRRPYRSRPEIGPDAKLDFSQFHPIDHNLLECQGYPGGRRQHLRYRWQFFVEPWIYSHTLCAIGIHPHQGQAFRRAAVGELWYTATTCTMCHRSMSDWQPE